MERIHILLIPLLLGILYFASTVVMISHMTVVERKKHSFFASLGYLTITGLGLLITLVFASIMYVVAAHEVTEKQKNPTQYERVEEPLYKLKK